MTSFHLTPFIFLVRNFLESLEWWEKTEMEIGETQRQGQRQRETDIKELQGSFYCVINVISFGDFYRDCKTYLIAFQLHLNTRPIFIECNP